MVNFGPLAAEIVSGVLGHPSYFQQLPRLRSVTARHSSSGRQPKFVALNTGRHLEGRPSRWALAHILVYIKISAVIWKVTEKEIAKKLTKILMTCTEIPIVSLHNMPIMHRIIRYDT